MPTETARNISSSVSSRFMDFIKSYVFDGILLVALGLVFLLLPEASLTVLCVILGVALIVMGMLKLIFFAATAKALRRPVKVIIGVIQMVLGFALIIKPDVFINLFQIVVGVVLIYGSLLLFINAYRLRKIRGTFFVLSIIFGLIILALGAIIVANPIAFAGFMMQLQGVALIIEGVGLIVAMHTIKREAKNAAAALDSRIRTVEARLDEAIPAEVVKESDEYFPQEEERGRTEYYRFNR